MLGERDRQRIETWLQLQYSKYRIEPDWWREGRGVDAKELLARAFERYQANGIAPVPSMNMKPAENVRQITAKPR